MDRKVIITKETVEAIRDEKGISDIALGKHARFLSDALIAEGEWVGSATYWTKLIAGIRVYLEAGGIEHVPVIKQSAAHENFQEKYKAFKRAITVRLRIKYPELYDHEVDYEEYQDMLFTLKKAFGFHEDTSQMNVAEFDAWRRLWELVNRWTYKKGVRIEHNFDIRD